MKVRDRRNLPRAVDGILTKIRGGKPRASRLGPLIGALRVTCEARGLTLVTVPCPAKPPCLVWIFKGEVPQRLRKVVRRNASCRTYRFTSCKTDEDIECEGDNEYEYARRLDLNGLVRLFFEQTPIALFEFNGKIHLHTPDFVVEWHRGGMTVVDVVGRDVERPFRYRISRTPRRRFRKRTQRAPIDYAAKREREKQLLAAAGQVYGRFGMEHVVVRAEELDDRCWRENVNTIFPHRTSHVTLRTRLAVHEQLAGKEEATLWALLREVPLVEAELWSLVATGEIRVDLGKPINDSTRVFAGQAVGR
jgi:hypothetical protein